MKVLIITCFESNDERVGFVYDACIKKGYDVSVLTSDFSHINKKKRNNINNKYKYIKTKPYNKNLSISRIKSHIQFAKDVFIEVKKCNPDLIWLMVPANSLIKEANLYKTNNPSVKIIIDVIDMWPESLPIRINKNIFPFNIWKNIRKNNINCADYLVTECDLYQDILCNEFRKTFKTIYWAREAGTVNKELNLPDDKLSLCYIGSINNIIDIERIYNLIKSSDNPVILHIIGDGEKKDEFINRLKEVCEVKYYGVIRDEEKKNEIFNKCHAGINIYKEGLYIGLTTKCIDYFEYGLPIINNIKGDTWIFVVEDDIGININNETKLKSEELINMRLNNKNIFDLFNRNFTKTVFEERCIEVIDEVLK